MQIARRTASATEGIAAVRAAAENGVGRTSDVPVLGQCPEAYASSRSWYGLPRPQTMTESRDRLAVQLVNVPVQSIRAARRPTACGASASALPSPMRDGE